jgi:mRNA interferase HigB
MRVIAQKTLRVFSLKHQDCEQQLKTWYKEAEDAHCKGPRDIKRDYPSATFFFGR